MKHITKITFAAVLILSLASCQSSKSGCYDFSSTSEKIKSAENLETNSDYIFTKVVCKP